MLSEETNPPPELYTAITTGDFRKFGGEVYEPPTEAGFERILQNIDSYDEIEALISEVKSLIRNDETICSASKKKLLRSLKASPNKFEGQTIFLFECLKFVVENGNNTYVRRVKDQIRQLQKDARRLAGQFSMDSRLLYAEENKGEDYAISHENEPDNNTI